MTVDKELNLIIQATKEFAHKELAENREENDKYPFGPFFYDVVEKAFQLDLFHILLPQDVNGLDLGISVLSAVMENLSQEDSSLAGIIFTTVAAQQLMLEAGNRLELRHITDNQTLHKFLLAMPVFNNPSELEQLAQAVKMDGDYLLRGKIEYLVLGNQAKHALIPAKLADTKGYSFFLVDLNQQGVSISDPVLSLGMHACPAVDVDFKDALGMLIGDENAGPLYFEKMADRMHIAAAAMALGVMKGSFKEAFNYAKNREQGGQKIVNWSEVRMMLANMAVNISACEMILAKATELADSPFFKWEAKARAAALTIQEMACAATNDGIQIMGGVGYMKDFGQEKRFRDARHIQALLGITPVKKITFLEKML